MARRVNETDMKDGQVREDMKDCQVREDYVKDGQVREDYVKDGQVREDYVKDGKLRRSEKCDVMPSYTNQSSWPLCILWRFCNCLLYKSPTPISPPGNLRTLTGAGEEPWSLRC
ncbi:hypothetical protein Pmani_014480 [Petrolisthes manimaculis]|uniref:Uncharacterized protein n=1 Tax=Petrolisthes manimaculis TaxID=1843537 RepID=A0AAE1U8P6_9EUCA|nr:hypothetical protein Pmani_014480 [Petrolisthes manimaculis]